MQSSETEVDVRFTRIELSLLATAVLLPLPLVTGLIIVRMHPAFEGQWNAFWIHARLLPATINLTLAGACVLGLLMGLATLLVRSRRINRHWRQRIGLFKPARLLKLQVLPHDAQADIADWSAERLWAASMMPEHSEAGRTLAEAELLRRPAKMPPLYVPGYVSKKSAVRITRNAFGVRHAIRQFLGWLALVAWAILITILVFIIFYDLNHRSPGSGSAAFLRSHPKVLSIIGPLAGFAALAILLHVLFKRAYIWLKSRPVRVLFLRKFNERTLATPFRVFVKKHLRPYGHLVLLADRNIKTRWTTWYASRFQWETLGDPYELTLEVLYVPFAFFMRLFNRIKWGPPQVWSAKDFRALGRALRSRRWLNKQTQVYLNGFFVRCSDKWWHVVVELMMLSADVIVLDTTNIAGGTEWEIDAIDRLGLWSRVVAVSQERPAGEIHTPHPKVDANMSRLGRTQQVYTRKGKLEDLARFRADMQNAAMLAVADNAARWPDLVR